MNARSFRRIGLMCAVLVMVVMVAFPSAHAATNDKFFSNSTTTGSCATLCKGLVTSSGTASTSTVVAAAVEGSAPALDSGANSDKTGTWSAGTTISVASFATAQSPDTVLVLVASSKTTTPIQSAPSGTGLTCDASARREQAGTAALGVSEWACHASGTISSETVTCNLSATPTWGICEVIAINGAEDPTGTWNPFDKSTTTGVPCAGQRNSGSSTVAPTTNGATIATCTSGQITTLNANDFWIGIEEETDTTVQTAGNLGGVAATFIHTTTSTGGLSVERRASSATVSATLAGTFGTAESRWNIIVDVLQAAPTFYKLEPETSATLSGTPSTAANGFSGVGWLDGTSGVLAGFKDFQIGTWQIDEKNGAGSITGAPVARLFVTAWDCTTNACTTATSVWHNWDTGTNIVGATAQTAHSFTTASVTTFSIASTHFLAVEEWVAWQYSGSTSSTTVTLTTIDTSWDVIAPGIDYAESTSASITIKTAMKYDAIVAGKAEETGTYIVGTATAFTVAAKAAITLAANAAQKIGFLRGFAVSIAVTISNAVTATQSSTGDVITISNRATTFSPAVSITLSAAKTAQASFFRAGSGSIGVVSTVAERLAFSRAPTASIGVTAAASEAFAYGRTFSGSIGIASSLSRQVSSLRTFSSSIGVVASLSAMKGKLIGLSASIGAASSSSVVASYGRFPSGLIGSASGLGSQAHIQSAPSVGCNFGLGAVGVSGFAVILVLLAGIAVVAVAVLGRRADLSVRAKEIMLGSVIVGVVIAVVLLAALFLGGC